jgi:diguanylate cyclase
MIEQGSMPSITEAAIQPSEIAREVIRLLAIRKIAPTPENFTQFYNEVAAINAPEHITLEARLHRWADNLHENAAAKPEVVSLIKGIRQKNWTETPALLFDVIQLINQPVPETQGLIGWVTFFKAFLRDFELTHKNWTKAQKKASLDRIFISSSSSPSLLLERLNKMLLTWRGDETDQIVESINGVEGSSTELNQLEAENTHLLTIVAAFKRSVQTLIKAPLIDQLNWAPTKINELYQLTEQIERVTHEDEIAALTYTIQGYWHDFADEYQSLDEINQALVNILRNFFRHLVDIFPPEDMLQDQVDSVERALAMPLTQQGVQAAELSIREFLIRQSTLKESLTETKASLKELVAIFVDRIASLSNMTGEYADRINLYVTQIEATLDLASLPNILQSILTDTRNTQTGINASRTELVDARQKLEDYENKVSELKKELNTMNGLLNEDALTQALNRRGFERVYDIEVARCRRKEESLCISMIDVDNFKKLNDTMGHQVGDQVLCFLVDVAKQVIRPTDYVARFGGEEFVLILPQAELEDATKVVDRIRRELTKRIFLHNHQKLMVTFSAGVVQLGSEETCHQVIERADQAMYLAKSTGKNKVVAV